MDAERKNIYISEKMFIDISTGEVIKEEELINYLIINKYKTYDRSNRTRTKIVWVNECERSKNRGKQLKLFDPDN